MIHLSGVVGMEQAIRNFIPLLRTAGNFKLMNCLFWNNYFLLIFSDHSWLHVTETTGCETSDRGDYCILV